MKKLNKIFSIVCVWLVIVIFVSCSADGKNEKIIIIGAGSSAIAAATKLIENGYKNIVMLEAENRIGGRVYTRDFGPNRIDIGAQWCLGEKDNAVFDLAEPYDLLEHSQLKYFKHFSLSNGAEVSQEIGDQLVDILYNITEENDELNEDSEHSLGEYVIPRFKSMIKHLDLNETFTDEFLNYAELLLSIHNGFESWNDESGAGIASYHECDGSQTLSWRNKGYHKILDILMKKYPDPANDIHLEQKIEFNKSVKKILNGNGSVRVITEDGSEFIGDKVIVTVSLGVLKERHTELFEPQLSERKREAIKHLSFGTINKIYLEFESKWWPYDWEGVNNIWSSDPGEIAEHVNNSTMWLSRLVGIYQVDFVQNILCGWVSETDNQNYEHLSDDQIKRDILNHLEKLTNHQFEISELKSFLRSRWHSNPNFRGSWAFRGKTAQQLNITNSHLAEPIKNADGKNIVLFAGDATNDIHYGTVHGAIESGWRAAQEIIDEI